MIDLDRNNKVYHTSLSGLRRVSTEEKFETMDIKEDEEFPITVSNPVVNEGMKSYVSYTLAGKMMEEPVIRRYSDFFALRKKLLERWPGVYIPNIPPKKAVGNMDSEVIEMRLQLLNRFMQRIYTFPDIFASEEVQIFLSNANDVTKALDSMKVQTFEDLVKKYKKCFPDFYEAYDVNGAKMKLSEFQEFLKRALTNLRTFKDGVYDTLLKKDQELLQYYAFLKGLNEFEKYTLLEYSNNQDSKLVFFNPQNPDLFIKLNKMVTLVTKDSLKNPFVTLYGGINEEEVDIEAMIEALDSINSLNAMLENLAQKRASVENELNDSNSGKRSIKSIFSFQSKENKMMELEKEKLSLDVAIGDLEMVIKLITFNMEYFMEYYRNEKVQEYYSELREYSEIQQGNGMMLCSLWDAILKDSNIARIKDN